MARSVKTITTSWVQIATTQALITITKAGPGQIFFNETASDVAAMVIASNELGAINEQIQQADGVTTFCKASAAGWLLIVDEA